jgi:hypothetical protein
MGAKGIDLDDGVTRYDVINNVVIDGLQKFKGNFINVKGNLLFPGWYGCVWMTPFNYEPANMVYEGNTCYTGFLPPFYFNAVDYAAKALCFTRNLQARNNRWIGGRMDNAWDGCGGDKVTRQTWASKYGQDKSSSWSSSILTEQARLDLIEGKLRTLFPSPYW